MTKSVKKLINEYINKIKDLNSSGKAREESFSGDLQHFLNEFIKSTANPGIKIIHQPKYYINESKRKCRPDFEFLYNGINIGYLETKIIGFNLDDYLKSDQIAKYKKLKSKNLILTDCLKWIWIHNGKVIKEVILCEEKTLTQEIIELSESKCQEITKLISDFLWKIPPEITKANELAKILAEPTRRIKENIKSEVDRQLKNKDADELIGLFNEFKKNIFENMTTDEFSDAFAQIFTYSLFLVKLNLPLNQDIKLDLDNMTRHTPQSFLLIRGIIQKCNNILQKEYLKIYIERILSVINCINTSKLASDLRFTQNDAQKDPYIYFYEDFLKAYDPGKRVEAGVYYTPNPIVCSIVKNIHELLKKDFVLEDGLGDDSIKILDFACGTGTFLLQIYNQILTNTNSFNYEETIKDHILKNIFGFEILIPAYCISHLKLSQYLKEKAEYNLGENERVQVYFTNTLENLKSEGQIPGCLPEVAKEGKKAKEIKNDKILVITGNPPYNTNSTNNSDYIKKLIKPYYPKDEIKETNLKILRDDYVKFIRFAEDKITDIGKGIVGIITNHSFIDSPIFRTMRKHLMDTFDEIYIIDLHGSAIKSEKCPDGSPDKNVFNIRQGVAISFFIKNDKIEEKGIYKSDIFGTREEKFEQILNIDLIKEKTRFAKINPSKPFYIFTAQDDTFKKEYERGWNLMDIFEIKGVGIGSSRDSVAYQNSKERLKEVLNDFKDLSVSEIKEKYKKEKTESSDKKTKYAKQIIEEFKIKEEYLKRVNYRPFDEKWTYYTNESSGFLTGPRYKIMKHFLPDTTKNIGLVFSRQGKNCYDRVFVSDKIIDCNFLPGKGYIAPLYIYTNYFDKIQKEKNFTEKFINMLDEEFNNSPTPEEVLSYIYAILHSQTYRKKYLDFLKTDFPRIPFNFDLTSFENSFKKLSKIGQELIDAHLMKEVSQPEIGDPRIIEDEKCNIFIEKVNYDEANQRLFFNKTCFFQKVSPEVYNFKIGGHQVLHKYLKSREGENINVTKHISKIIKVIDFTIKKMEDIENLIKDVI